MSLSKMLRCVVDKIIRIQRNFFWTADEIRKGLPLVKWEIIQRPKKFGGLGVGDLVIKNTTLLFKWWWKFSNKSAPLWKKFICSNYDLDMNRALIDQQLPGKGGLWNQIAILRRGLQVGMKLFWAALLKK